MTTEQPDACAYCGATLPEPSPISPRHIAWKATAGALNALPEPVRKYITDLETRCDPAGDTSKIAMLVDQNDMLKAKLGEIEIARHLASEISPWLYSTGKPPDKLNEMFRKWVDEGELPESMAEIDKAAKVSDG